MARVRDPKATRRRILEAAHREFGRNGYRAGSLNGIVEAAGVTKGALFHHFPGKEALALAVIEEVLAPALRERWIDPLEAAAADAGEDGLKRMARLLVAELEGGEEREPVNPASALAAFLVDSGDAGDSGDPVRRCVDDLFSEWRGAVARVLETGQTRGSVHPNIVPSDEAAFLVCSLAGLAILGKTARNPPPLTQSAIRAASAYLETLRAPNE